MSNLASILLDPTFCNYNRAAVRATNRLIDIKWAPIQRGADADDAMAPGECMGRNLAEEFDRIEDECVAYVAPRFDMTPEALLADIHWASYYDEQLTYLAQDRRDARNGIGEK